MDYFEAAQAAVSIGCVVVTVASAICAATPTPAPGSRLARAYRIIEIAGLMVGRAKQTGLVQVDPRAEKVGDNIVAVVSALASRRETAPPPPPAFPHT